MHRLFAALAALVLLALPSAARPEASDIAAAARGVVRVVIMSADGDQVAPLSHGTGFAVTPNKIVTNAHVVREAMQDDTLRIAIVPSDGGSADYARIVTVSSAKDLALLETTGPLRLPRLTIAGIPAGDGDEVAAVGYPMNVDRAQGLDLADIFRPQPPVKSRGFVSGARPSRDIDTVLHTAAIARGNSGGPLLDNCGRVLGVNSFGTTSDDGSDAEFSFAISDKELVPFLKSAGIEPAVNALPCRSMAQLDEAERERVAAEQAAARAKLASRAEATRAERERAQLEAELSVMNDRENAMAIAGVLLLVAAGAGFAGFNARGGERGGRTIRVAGAVSVAALVAALAIWFTRPGFDAIERRTSDILSQRGSSGGVSASAEDASHVAELTCTIQPDRSRIVSEPPKDMDFAWNPNGCVNRRTQYGFADGKWSRLFVPADDDAVSVNSFDPDTRTFRTDRYALGQSTMAKARTARAAYKAPACGSEGAAGKLGDMQSAVTALLSAEANERLVYACRPKAS